jgi:hypothetical protein
VELGRKVIALEVYKKCDAMSDVSELIKVEYETLMKSSDAHVLTYMAAEKQLIT